MLSFYPGPSKVYPEVLGFIQEAFQEGMVSINHRSPRFEKLLKATLDSLHEKWNIPADYTIYFISSATEAWEIVSQSLVEEKSMHLYNGAFGKKWAHYASQIHPESVSHAFDLQASLSDISKNIDFSGIDTLCLVQSETSNGSGQVIQRSDYALDPSSILAVDATSSMGGILLPWLEADVWLASVQKCLGIPAGLGLLICSPKALARAEKLQKRAHYNDILLMEENRKLFQTHYTPNVLSIFVLHKLTQFLPNLTEIHAQTMEKSTRLAEFWDTQKGLDFLIKNPALRLPTVLALKGNPTDIQNIKNICLQNQIELGNGYGEWKENTVRIANFPSHTSADFDQLFNTLRHGL
jgi:phosphoserine aminotransferase